MHCYAHRVSRTISRTISRFVGFFLQKEAFWIIHPSLSFPAKKYHYSRIFYGIIQYFITFRSQIWGVSFPSPTPISSKVNSSPSTLLSILLSLLSLSTTLSKSFLLLPPLASPSLWVAQSFCFPLSAFNCGKSQAWKLQVAPGVRPLMGEKRKRRALYRREKSLTWLPPAFYFLTLAGAGGLSLSRVWKTHLHDHTDTDTHTHTHTHIHTHTLSLSQYQTHTF